MSRRREEYFCDPICSGPVFLSLSARYRSQLRRLVEQTQVPVDDALKLSEFIAWLVEHHLASACARAQETTDVETRQRVMGAVIAELYILCCRCFIVQLVHAAYNRFRSSVGDWQCASVIGVVKQMHEDVSEYSGNYHTARDPVEVFRISLEVIEPYWQRYTKWASEQLSRVHMQPRRLSSAADEHVASMMSIDLRSGGPDMEGTFKAVTDAHGNINVPKIQRTRSGSRIVSAPTPRVQKLFFADIADAPENLKDANEVNENSRNYRLAYTMMLGLETVVRIAAHSRLRIYQQSVLGLSSFVDACKDYLEEIDFGFLNEAMIEIREYRGRNLSDDVLQRVLSAVSYRYTLPSAGSQFSPEHVLGDGDGLWFVDLAPALFARVRQLCKIDDVAYLSSLAQKRFSFIEFNSNSKSGEVFFFSHDGKFILKTVSHKEASVLLTMLPEYLHRIQAGASLLMRICGLYHVHAVKDARPVFFIVAISVFDDSGLGLHQQFDLKGSSAGRTARDHEAVKKDNNWTQGKMRVNLPADMKRSVAAALEADATFLARHQVLDYSVLIGIHDRHSLVRGRHNKGVKLLQDVLKEHLVSPRGAAIGAPRLSVEQPNPGEKLSPPPPTPTPTASVIKSARKDVSSRSAPSLQLDGQREGQGQPAAPASASKSGQEAEVTAVEARQVAPTTKSHARANGNGANAAGAGDGSARGSGVEAGADGDSKPQVALEGVAAAEERDASGAVGQHLPSCVISQRSLGPRDGSAAGGARSAEAEAEAVSPAAAAASDRDPERKQGGGGACEFGCDICAEQFASRADLASHTALCRGLHRLLQQYARHDAAGLGKGAPVVTRSAARSMVAGRAFGTRGGIGDLSEGTEDADLTIDPDCIEIEETEEAVDAEGVEEVEKVEEAGMAHSAGMAREQRLRDRESQVDGMLDWIRERERDMKQHLSEALCEQQHLRDLLLAERDHKSCTEEQSRRRLPPRPLVEGVRENEEARGMPRAADQLGRPDAGLGTGTQSTEEGGGREVRDAPAEDAIFAQGVGTRGCPVLVSPRSEEDSVRPSVASQQVTVPIAREARSGEARPEEVEESLLPAHVEAEAGAAALRSAVVAVHSRLTARRLEGGTLCRENSSSSLEDVVSEDIGGSCVAEKEGDRAKLWRGIHGPIHAEGVSGLNGQFVYFIGIIDFLIPWSAKKKGEFLLNCMRGRRLTASCMPPKAYAKRQTKFVTLNVLRLFNTRNAIKYACNFSARPHELELFNIEGATSHKYRHRPAAASRRPTTGSRLVTAFTRRERAPSPEPQTQLKPLALVPQTQLKPLALVQKPSFTMQRSHTE